jgi:LuxR family transcriptional regulator, maltose regulon positive regulatory protein
MSGREAARIEAAEPHRGSGAPITSGVSCSRSRGGLEVVPGSYGAAHGRPRLGEHNPRETPAALAPVRDGPIPRAHLLWAAAALLLEVIADDAPGDLDAAALALERDLGLAEPDRVLFPALIRVALGLLERYAGPGPGEAALAAELAGLLGEVKRPAPPSAEPAWPGEPLTGSETRVLRYLPTHLGAPEIAAELYLSANTVKTHLRHLYRKLGAHSRQEAVQRARAIGLLTGSSRRP